LYKVKETMSKRNVILLHVFTWLFGAFLNLRDYKELANPERLSIYIASTFFLAVSFYTFYFYVVPCFLEKKKYYKFIIVSLAVLALLTFIAYSSLLLIVAIFNHNFSNFYEIYSFKMHLSGMSVVTVAAIFGSFFKIFLNWINTTNQKEQLEKDKAISELALLKSKVNPHFLFNTLNNIDALIYHDQDKASQALLKLSEIMRYMSYETVSEYVSLSKEINYIANIVSLYSLRVTNPELIKIDIPDNYPDLNIAPLLFIPFIENAFKYASFKGDRSGIEIKFTVEDKRVFFSSSNYYDSTERKPTLGYSGVGLANVKQRLEHIYKDKYWLDITDKNGLFKVELRIVTNGN